MFSIRNYFTIPAICALWLQQAHVGCEAFVSPIVVAPQSVAPARSMFRNNAPAVLCSTATSERAMASTDTDDDDDDDDDDDEYEYIEYEDLTEADLFGSEWRVGTCWDNKQNKIDETWTRLETKGDKNVAVWGDNSEGTWSFDVASQFLTISKNYVWGKNIWAGQVDDYYFLKGTVRGWTYVTAASVLGQWQGTRLGVDAEEAGTPPWFEEDEDEEETMPAEIAASTTAVEEKTEKPVETKLQDDDKVEEPVEVKASSEKEQQKKRADAAARALLAARIQNDAKAKKDE